LVGQDEKPKQPGSCEILYNNLLNLSVAIAFISDQLASNALPFNILVD